LARVLNNRPPNPHTGWIFFFLNKNFLPQFSQELLGTIIEEAKERKKEKGPQKKKKKNPNQGFCEDGCLNFFFLNLLFLTFKFKYLKIYKLNI
jgi:hypothetical protein